ncbi:ral guanine nucleotide dissociation stimulator-like [Thomomys bottae]
MDPAAGAYLRMLVLLSTQTWNPGVARSTSCQGRPGEPSTATGLSALEQKPLKGSFSSVYKEGFLDENQMTMGEPRRAETLNSGTLEELVDHLVPAQLMGEPFFVPTFLSSYRRFTSPQQVLDLLFKRFCRCDVPLDSCGEAEILPYYSEKTIPQDQLRNAISCILGTWLDLYSEDFCQPLQRSCLKKLMVYLQSYMPGSDVECRANMLLAQMEALEPKKAESEGAIQKGSALPLPGLYLVQK